MVNNMLRAINIALINKEKITIYNFGEFYVVKSNVKEIHDFATGKRVPFEGKYIIKFRAAPAITKMLNERAEVKSE
jgi:nucleoid DNA-binding protein